jgi:hypothetical protein
MFAELAKYFSKNNFSKVKFYKKIINRYNYKSFLLDMMKCICIPY